MGHKEKCLVQTPWADRSSTSAALCCCHCYSKSLCLDHCGQRERQVRATQLWTDLAKKSDPPRGDGAALRLRTEALLSCIKDETQQTQF